MEFLKKNKKQIIILVVLLIAFLITKKFGVESYEEAPVNTTTSIVQMPENKKAPASVKESEAEAEPEAKAKPETEAEEDSEPEVEETKLDSVSETESKVTPVAEDEEVVEVETDTKAETVKDTATDTKTSTKSDTKAETAKNTNPDSNTETKNKQVEIKYKFRNKGLWEEHFEKHGEEFPYSSKEEYLEGANIMMENPDKLHKSEKEDGDDVYYLESTNEFIIISGDGYLRTYFKPSRGKAYFDKQ